MSLQLCEQMRTYLQELLNEAIDYEFSTCYIRNIKSYYQRLLSLIKNEQYVKCEQMLNFMFRDYIQSARESELLKLSLYKILETNDGSNVLNIIKFINKLKNEGKIFNFSNKYIEYLTELNYEYIEYALNKNNEYVFEKFKKDKLIIKEMRQNEFDEKILDFHPPQ